MNTKQAKSKIKMLQIPVTEKEFDILKAKAVLKIWPLLTE